MAESNSCRCEDEERLCSCLRVDIFSLLVMLSGQKQHRQGGCFFLRHLELHQPCSSLSSRRWVARVNILFVDPWRGQTTVAKADHVHSPRSAGEPLNGSDVDWSNHPLSTGQLGGYAFKLTRATRSERLNCCAPRVPHPSRVHERTRVHERNGAPISRRAPVARGVARVNTLFVDPWRGQTMPTPLEARESRRMV
jgi:hypothetical protein